MLGDRVLGRHLVQQVGPSLRITLTQAEENLPLFLFDPFHDVVERGIGRSAVGPPDDFLGAVAVLTAELEPEAGQDNARDHNGYDRQREDAETG